MKRNESWIGSLGSGFLAGLSALIPGSAFTGAYASSFLQNAAEGKPRWRWIGFGALFLLGVLLGTLPRLLSGVRYLQSTFPLASALLFLFLSLGFALPVISWEVQRKGRTLLELSLFLILLVAGASASSLLSFFGREESPNSIGTGFGGLFLTGFLSGFFLFLPGIPLAPLTNLLGVSSSFEKILMNIPDNIDRMASFLSLFSALFGLLVHALVFAYPYRWVYRRAKNFFSGWVIGASLSSSLFAFFSRFPYPSNDGFPMANGAEIQTMANWGFPLFGLTLAAVLLLAFGRLPFHGKEDAEPLPLYGPKGDGGAKKE